MMKKKTYIAPLLVVVPVKPHSILAGTNGSNSVVGGDDEASIGSGGSGGSGYVGGDGETGYSRRGGGLWGDDY